TYLFAVGPSAVCRPIRSFADVSAGRHLYRPISGPRAVSQRVVHAALSVSRRVLLAGQIPDPRRAAATQYQEAYRGGAHRRRMASRVEFRAVVTVSTR